MASNGSPPNGYPRVGIVVLNYNNYWDTVECLKSLHLLDYPNKDIVIVDNGSTNDSLAVIEEELGTTGVTYTRVSEQSSLQPMNETNGLVLIEAEANRGYSAGNNIGARVALNRGARFILVINNDTVLYPGSLYPLVDVLLEHPEVGVASPKIVELDGSISRTCTRRRPTLGYYFFTVGMGHSLFPGNRWEKRHYYLEEYDFEETRYVDVVSGSCFLIDAQIFDHIGLFDENVFLFSEEFILHEKLRRIGRKAAVVPGSTVLHKHARSRSQSDPAVIRRAARESQRYYLRAYRKYGLLRTEVAMVASYHPSVRGMGQAVRRRARLVTPWGRSAD